MAFNSNPLLSRRLVCQAAGGITLALTLPLATTHSHAQESSTMPGPIAEIVTFKLAPGVNDAEFMKQVEASGTFLRAQAGFLSRRLTKTAEGVYMDYVTWSSLKEAEQAIQASMSDASLAAFIQSIDPNSMKLDHQQIVSTLN